jgi:hypothetical protein
MTNVDYQKRDITTEGYRGMGRGRIKFWRMKSKEWTENIEMGSIERGD